MWNGSLNHFGLSDIADFLQCPLAHHDPQDDAKLCATILLRAAQQTNTNSLDELTEKVRLRVTPFSMAKELVSGYDNDIYRLRISIEDLSVHVENEQDNGHDSPTSLYGFNSKDIEGHCPDPGVFDRGVKLFKSNSVDVKSRSGVEYVAHVKGSGKTPYEVAIDAGLNASCTCQAWINSRERFCKHCVALALVWDSEGGPTQFDKLSEGERKSAILDSIGQLSPQDCKKILMARAESKTESISRLLFEVEAD